MEMYQFQYRLIRSEKYSSNKVGENALLKAYRTAGTARSFRTDGLKYTEGLLTLRVHGNEERNRYPNITNLYCSTYSTDES